MTADGEPPAGHPDHATHDGCPDGIDSLERFIRSCLDKLDQEPYLHRNNVRELLEEIAYHWRDVTTGAATIAELVAASERLGWLPELGDAERREIITRLIDGSGLFVAEDGGFQFAYQTVQKYLAAHHIQRHSRWPRWWQLRTYLAPWKTWPDAGVMLFLAALRWREAKPAAIERRLRRLLRERHRDADIGFVIELCQWDLLGGSDIRNPTVGFLRRKLADGRQDEGRWVTMAERLCQLDPTELEKIVKYPSPTITPDRRLAAVKVLMRDNPARGAQTLNHLAHSLTETGTPDDWLNTAVRIRNHHDHGLGKRTILLLAKNPEMGNKLRVKAAILADWLPLLCELIEREGDLSNDERLELSAELLRRNRNMAVTSMVRFAQTACEDKTPLRITRMIMIHDEYKHVAWRIADEVAWANPKIGSSAVRLDAVILIGEIKPAEAIPELKRLSQDQSGSMTGEVRVKAAKRIVTEHGGQITAVVDLGDDPKLDRTDRIEAAKFVGAREPATGARLYISIAKTYPPEDKSRLDLLREAYNLARAPAADALAEVAENPRIPGKIRLDAVEIAHQMLGMQRTIDLYTTIAKTTDNDSALTAARKVTERNPDAGRRLMGELAANPRKDIISFRLPAALEAGIYGKPVLIELADTAQPDTVVLDAAKGLSAIGSKKEAERALQKLVEKHWAGKVRIDAALALPETSTAVDALITIIEDHREEETIRFDAGVKAKKKHEKKGRQALREFANDPKTSETTRKKVRRYLNE